MAQITGQTGRMNLSNSYVVFGDWNININDNDEPGLKEPWSGWLEIQKSDYHTILDSINKMNTEISAEFYGDKEIKYNGNIQITRFHIVPLIYP